MANIYVKKSPSHSDIDLELEEFVSIAMLKDLHISYVDYIEVCCENGEIVTFNSDLLANIRKHKKDARLAKLPKIDTITIYLNLLLAEQLFKARVKSMLSSLSS